MCVHFAYRTQILTCVTLFTKTFLRTKNRKFVRKYTHGLSCRTTENSRKDKNKDTKKLTKLPRRLVLESQQKFVYGDACKM